MNCDKVKEYLSEYIDEGLEPTIKALVEEHLSACEGCQQEVSSLRMLIEDLGSMETVAPPKDFLDQLHKRMERRSWISRILYTLSLPMRVKLPMKLAGAVMMAVLVFTIFQLQEDQYGTKITPLVRKPTQPESSPPRVPEVPQEVGTQEETYSSEAVKEKAKPAPQTMRAVVKKDEAELSPNNAMKEITLVETKKDHSLRERDRVEPSLQKAAAPMQESTQPESSPPRMAKTSLKTSVHEEIEKTGVVWEEGEPKKLQTDLRVIAEKDEAMSLADHSVKRISHVETKADHPLRKGGWIELSLVLERAQSTDTFETASPMEIPQAREMKVKRTLIVREAVTTDQQEGDESMKHLFPRLREVIKRAGGEVVSLEYDEGTHILESVHVEIPAEQISMFQNDLQTLGELHGTPISSTGEDEEVLPIRIKLLTP